jgi:hypothetical protein
LSANRKLPNGRRSKMLDQTALARLFFERGNMFGQKK